MDETQRPTSAAGSQQNPMNLSINAAERSIERLAPISVRAGIQLTEAFAELTEHWKQYTEIEGADRIAAIIKDLTVEEQLERCEHMEKIEIIGIVRYNLRKMTTIKEENEMLTQQNRELAEKMHRVEHRIAKAQGQVFDKMHKTVRQILDDFHTRELDLARKTEELEAERMNLTAKNSKLEAKVENLERKLEELEQKSTSLQQKKQELEGTVEEKESLFERLAKKYDEQSDEVFQLRESLEQSKQTVREKSDEAVQEALDAQNLRIMLVKQKDEIWEQARRHEQAIKDDMDEYRSKLEHQMVMLRKKCKDEMETIGKEHRTALYQRDSRIQMLATELQKKQLDVDKYEKHLEMIVAQIKGNMKRSLAVNYKDLIESISAINVPEPPSNRNDSWLDAVREIEAENNKENGKKRTNSGRSSCPPSPKRSVGVQARPEREAPRVVVRRPMPGPFQTTSARLPSTSSSHHHRK
ncbi:unnamed protein product [Caenorhabditis sp. 36 PRJEB53466]|nr:unnamed protein product [Caenorhabditis sp. 36 PRJEB53466]